MTSNRTTRIAGALATATCLCAPAMAGAQAIDFWTQTYGDNVAWARLLDDLATEFEAESRTAVNIETVSWPNAFQTWLMVSNGGAAPDCGDTYRLHSFAGIGGDAAGPRRSPSSATAGPSWRRSVTRAPSRM